jgi:hypothetical protein
MMMATHALIGATLGRFIRNRPAAFLAGVLSHGIADVIPHKEFHLKTDAPVAALAFAFIAWKYGADSPEMAGALGGVIPDAEHVPAVFGAGHEHEIFPTHGDFPQPWPHSMGIEPDDNRIQIGLALSALMILGEK